VALIFIGIVIVAVFFLRKQWASTEERNARLKARLAGEDEILVSTVLNHVYCPNCVLQLIVSAFWLMPMTKASSRAYLYAQSQIFLLLCNNCIL